MTSRERVLAAMRREQPDRVPLHMRGVRVWDDEWVATRDVSYRPVIEAVREHCDLIPVSGVDGVSPPMLTAAARELTELVTIDAGDWVIRRTVLHTPRGDLTQDYWVSKGRALPMVRKHFLETPEDAARLLSIPDVPETADFSDYFALRDRHPDHLVLCMIPIAGECVHDLLGTETFAYWWAEHRSVLFELREALQERALRIARAALEAGVGPVLATNGVEQVAPPIHSPQTYREFVLPEFRQLTELIHRRGALVHVHCHNRLNALLEDLVEAGWDVTHPLEPPPMGDVDLADAKRRVGRHLCLEGNIQIGEIYAAPTAQVISLVTEAMEAGKPGGGFILCPTASPHTPTLSHVSVDNYLALIETGVRLGEY